MAKTSPQPPGLLVHVSIFYIRNPHFNVKFSSEKHGGTLKDPQKHEYGNPWRLYFTAVLIYPPGLKEYTFRPVGRNVW